MAASGRAAAGGGTCTNTLGSAVTVGVEIYGPAGGAVLNDASATALSVGPGASVMFSTTPTAAFAVDALLGVAPSKGIARILTSANSTASKGLLCTAVLHHRNSFSPASMTTLPIIRKNTQVGQ